MKRSLLTAVLFIALAAAGCSPDISQTAHAKAPPESAAAASALAPRDRDFIEKAAQGGNAEVAIGALAAERAHGMDVAAFGRMVAADHAAANARLSAIATARGIALPASLGEHQAGFDRLVDKRFDPFDKEFAKVMLADHQEAAELFRSEAANGVDASVKAFAVATLPMIEAHLQQAAGLTLAHPSTQEETPPPTPATPSQPAAADRAHPIPRRRP